MTSARCVRAELSFFLILLCLLAPSARAETKLPADVLKTAARYQDLRSDGAAPFHMAASFEALGPAELTGAGTYEETWFSKDQWRRQISFASYEAVEIHNGRDTYVEENQPYEPSRVLLLLKAIVPTSLLETPYKPFRAKEWNSSDIPFGGTTFHRISTGDKDDPAMVRSVIFDSDELMVETQDGGLVTYYSSVLTFHSAKFPGKIAVKSLAKDELISIRIDKLADPQASASESLAFPSQASKNSGTLMPIEQGGPVKPPEVLKNDIGGVMNATAGMSQDPGTGLTAYAIVQFVIDKSGAVREPVILFSPKPAFGEAMVKAVSQWKYKPPNLAGEPCEMLATFHLATNASGPATGGVIRN